MKTPLVIRNRLISLVEKLVEDFEQDDLEWIGIDSLSVDNKALWVSYTEQTRCLHEQIKLLQDILELSNEEIDSVFTATQQGRFTNS